MVSVVRIELLGPLAVQGGDEAIRLSPKERALLIALALRPGKAVAVSELIDTLWDQDPPSSAHKTLQTYVSGLRRRLPEDTLLTVPNGYLLSVGPDAVDAYRFESMLAAADGREDEGDLGGAGDLVDQALELWRGPAMLDGRGVHAIDAAAERFEELRRGAVETRGRLWLLTDRSREFVAEFERAVTDEPLREQRWAQLMVALYRSGRQADALRAFQRLSSMLADELGIEPSLELMALDDAILQQRPASELPVVLGRRPPVPTDARPAPSNLIRTVSVHDGDQPVRGVLTGSDGSVVEVGPDGLRIGRSPENDLVLDDPKVSRSHASILYVEGGFAVADHHSTNGTFVQGGRVREATVLVNGDTVRIGDSSFVFGQLAIDADGPGTGG